MTIAYTRRRRGFSLVEIMIAVMILGIGLVMIGSAFPIGLRMATQSYDSTIAAMLAQSAIAALKMGRTADAQDGFTIPTWDASYREIYANHKGDVTLCECFDGNSGGVRYLFDGSVPGHAGGLLADRLGGNNINDWLPETERAYRPDPSFAYHVFYQRVADPHAVGAPRDGAKTFQVFVAVQKSRAGVSGGFASRFPPPSGPTTVSDLDVSARTLKLSKSHPVLAGSVLLDTANGDFYRVIDVEDDGSSQIVTLSSTPRSSLSGHGVWVLDSVVEVFTTMVSKRLP